MLFLQTHYPKYPTSLQLYTKIQVCAPCQAANFSILLFMLRQLICFYQAMCIPLEGTLLTPLPLLFIFVIIVKLYNCRVLWGAMLEGGVLRSNHELVNFAKQKLLGGDFGAFKDVPEKDQESAAIAILASRCALNISPV